MITIENLVLDTTQEKQEIKKKGLLDIIAINRVGKNVMAVAIVDTAGDRIRTAIIHLVKHNTNAMCLHLKLKYIGTAGNYNLFLQDIIPRR